MAMIYKTRNLKNLATLADNTRYLATKWHEYCEANGIQILIYETIRSKETQARYVAKGASQTMRSYHIVGQALDFVLVDDKGNALWSAYKTPEAKLAVAEAKRLGFTWGGDWSSFVDSPHFQYEYKGYGTDTFGKAPTVSVSVPKPVSTSTEKAKSHKVVTGDTLSEIAVKYGLTVAKLREYNSLTSDRIFIGQVLKLVPVPKPVSKPKAPSIKAVGKIKVDKVNSFTYIYAKTSDTSKVLGKATKNAVFSISGSVTGWYEVIYKGERAYVKAKYASKV